MGGGRKVARSGCTMEQWIEPIYASEYRTDPSAHTAHKGFQWFDVNRLGPTKPILSTTTLTWQCEEFYTVYLK